MVIEGNFPNLMKGNLQKSIVLIMFSGQRLFSVRLGVRQRCPLGLPLFSTVMEVIASAVRQEKGRKGIQLRKEEIKLALCTNHTIVYIKNPKDSTKKFPELSLIRLQVTRATHRNRSYFYTSNIQLETEIRKTIPFTRAPKQV